MSDVVRAAGGLVWRRTRNGAVEVLVVHRPRYDDWSLPKGKLDPGESEEDAAVREVEEETGWRCRLDGPAGTAQYHDERGRPKVVRYFAMQPVVETGTPVDAHEVDDVQWWTAAHAEEALTHAFDRRLVAALADRA